jgi:hypothetical protein
VIFIGNYWIRSWSILTREESREEDFERGLSLVGNYCVGVLQRKRMECSQAYSGLVYLAFS